MIITSLSSSTVLDPDKFYYRDMEELVKEWLENGEGSSLWDYLGISESTFKKWLKQIKTGKIDA